VKDTENDEPVASFQGQKQLFTDDNQKPKALQTNNNQSRSLTQFDRPDPRNQPCSFTQFDRKDCNKFDNFVSAPFSTYSKLGHSSISVARAISSAQQYLLTNEDTKDSIYEEEATKDGFPELKFNSLS